MKHLIATAACCLTLLPACAADLTIRIDDVKSADGSVMVALYDSAATFMKKPVASTMTAAVKGSVTVTFNGLPEGEYAFSLYHDANGNGKMDRNAIGIPIEDYAFSNNAMGTMGPPSYEQARLSVPAAGLSTRVTLR